MNTVTRTVCTIGGIVLFASPGASQNAPAVRQPAIEVARLAQRATPADERQPRRGRPPAARAASSQYEETFRHNVELGSKRSFELSTVAVGDIVVTGVEGRTIRIAATKRVRHPNEAIARSILEGVNIRVDERGGFVEALTDVPPQRGNAPVFIDFDIAVPRDTDVSLRTWAGTLRVENVRGELRVNANAGDVTLSSVNRVDATAIAGNLTIIDTDGQALKANTIGGTLQVRSVRARTIELRSVSGPVLVADVRCDRCTMNSTSGDLELSGPLTAGGRYTLASSLGSIRLVPTGSTGFDIEARTAPDHFSSEFPLRTDPSAARSTSPNAVYGTFGDGSAIISMRTFQGRVSIVKRDR